MKEIDSLLERSKRYVKSAKLLVKDKDFESAVSRAYYAMFYCAEALLLARDLSYSSHKSVISGFGEQFVKTGIFDKKMSKALTRAFEKRQVSDYDSAFTLSEKDAMTVLDEAQEFEEIANRYLKEQGFCK